MHDSKWNRGTLTQKFKIEIDIDKLLSHITDSILEQIFDDEDIDSVDFDEYYIEDTNLVIDGSYDAGFKSIYCPATRWEPADYEEERPFINDTDPQWMLSGLSEDIKKLVKIHRITEDVEKCEKKYFGEDDF